MESKINLNTDQIIPLKINDNEKLNELRSMDYVELANGRVPILGLPLVRNEDISSKFYKSVLFFMIVIMIFLLFIALMPVNKSDSIPSNGELAQYAKYQTTVNASAVDVYCARDRIFVENIILVTDYQGKENMINIDTLENEFVEIAPRYDGLSYYINLGREYKIKSIIIISDRYKHIDHINIDLYCGTDNVVGAQKKVWEFSGPLYNRRDNIIPITKLRKSIAADWKEVYNTGFNDLLELRDS